MPSSTDPATRPLLFARNVAKSFGRNRVLLDASLSLAPGEIAGVTGENGSGKSTLLNIIVGRLRPDAGTVVMSGRVGHCPQEMLVFETLTVRENFRYFAAAYGRADWPKRMQVLLGQLKFERYADTMVNHLSGGTRQKLNLAIAYLHDPDILVLDEPYSGFDWETYLHFWELTAELRERKRAVLVVSHFVQDRARFDSLYRIVAGRLEPEATR
ncbi:ABC transporter ATP-binding protein [candidate division WOR-3 bacterium]|uniref:ABC transporter ATP-binding protein n=1 Tax=candidate division WOR-3 bacterium TaxID=2052148 RepID=A0A938BSF2_UNCW3|nr:ABC transporter ATP-binding protein [candidate division WOR-3 bacterium]